MKPKRAIHRLEFLVLGTMLAVSMMACGGDNKKPADSAPATSGPLELRSPFPSVNLVSLDGETVNTEELMRGGDSVVFFVSLGCVACEELMQTWTELIEEIPADLHVFAVAEEESEFAADFVEQTPFPIPLYCDERGIFATEHDVEVFPTVVGTTAEGTIAYVGKAVTPLFTPAKAVAMLEEVKKARGGN